ncbi:hypothetical protein LY90DRAFT_265408 [Neocallimastix californiae]|nr:hypothetical protein LY90DRAFT_265408 [Neocallimastix californiae]|eukprot:ORX92740.1 hypothetical protein LY90DRAFT_265408 [Neocallimastix californiae]
MSSTEEVKKVEAEIPATQNKEESNSSEEETENKVVLSDEPKSIIMGIIAQLRKGADLHRVTLPTFVLEPRSMTERITDFLRHPDILLR